MEQVVAEIYQYSRYFTRMVLAREKDVELKNSFENIKILEVNVVYPFLLEVYADYEQKRLSRADFVAILKLIESYVFRRMISGLHATGLNKVFATLAKEIDKEHYLESVQANLLQRSGSARFPRDQEFKEIFDDSLNAKNNIVECIIPILPTCHGQSVFGKHLESTKRNLSEKAEPPSTHVSAHRGSSIFSLDETRLLIDVFKRDGHIDAAQLDGTVLRISARDPGFPITVVDFNHFFL
jgi:hypothetical protein